MSVFSDPLETPEPLSPSEYFIIDKDSCNTKPKHQGSSFSLQHLIRKCEQISKSKSASSSCSDTCLASWKCKTKRQRIYSDKNSSSTSSDEDIPILNRLKQKGRNRRRISSESDICTEQSLANPSSDKLDRAGQTAVQEMNSIVSNPDISLVSCSPGSVPDHNKNISTKSNTQASPSQKKSDESRSKFISTFRPMTPLPKTRSSSSSSSSATSKSRFASGKQKTRSSSSQVPEFRNDKSKSKSQRSRSSSYSTSRSRIHQRSRSVSRSRRYRSISLSPSRRSRWHRSRSSSSSRYFRSRSPVTRSRSTSGLRSSRYRSRSASSRGSRYKSRSDSPVKSKGYRARSVTSSSDRHRSRSESPRTSSSRLFSTGNNISRRCRSRSASSTRRRKSRSKYQSSPKRCRSQYSPWNPGRDNRSTPSSTSSSDVHRSKSLSVYHETQHHSERKNSCKFKRRRSASVSSSSTSSSDSATSSDSTSASSSTSGRRPWLKYRYKSSQDRKLSVTGRDPQERNESSKTVRDPWERNDISVTGRGPVDISTYSSAKTVLPPSTVGNVDTVTVTNAHHHSSSPHSNRPDDAQSDVPELSPFVKPEDILYFKRLLNTSEGNISEKEVQKRQFIRFLLKIKNGSQEVAKESMKAVKKMARRMDIFMLFHTLLPMCTKLSLVSETKKKLISVLDAIIFPTGRRLRPFLSSILDVIHPLLLDPQHEILAVKIITKLSKVFGQEGMLPVLRKELGSDDNLASLQSCRSLAVMTSVVGIEAVIPFISSLCTNVSAGPRKSGYELIQAVCHLMKERMQPYIGQLMDILCTGVKKKFDYTEWSGAVAGLAKISCETDIPSFSSAWDCLVYMYDTVSPHAGKLSVSVQKAVFSVLHLMSGAAKQDLQNVAESFGRMCSSSDVELRKCTVKVMHKLSQCTYIDDDLYDKMFLCPFIGQCLRSVFNDKEQEKGLRRHETVSEVAAVVIVAVLRKNGLKDVSYSVEKEILLAFCQAVNCQISQNTVILTSFLTVIKLLGRRLYSHTQDIQQALHDRQSSPQQAKLREQIQAEINGIGSGMETSSGLVLDGCVWNSAETS